MTADAAFTWETEALRASRARTPLDRPVETAGAAGRPWVTLREAYEHTGIPIETLRKWARRSAVPSFLDDTTAGVRRMVRMDAVRARASQLGRRISPVPKSPQEVEPLPEAAEEAPQTPPARAGAASRPGGAGAEVPTSAPEGTMIVPIAAWDKMLLQLGNLHQAGQQLAEARERAAKAETEAVFLRERLSDMRRELAEARDTTVRPVAREAEPEPETPPAARPPEKLWRYVYRGWRARRR